jgi:FG-GAP repeat protein
VGDPPSTTAYLYKRHGVTFKLAETLTRTEATTTSGFGSAVAISRDMILIGAPGEDTILYSFGVASGGAVYAFRHGPESPWIETQHFNAMNSGPYAAFGASLAVNRNGHYRIRRQRGRRRQLLEREHLESERASYELTASRDLNILGAPLADKEGRPATLLRRSAPQSSPLSYGVAVFDPPRAVHKALPHYAPT